MATDVDDSNRESHLISNLPLDFDLEMSEKDLEISELKKELEKNYRNYLQNLILKQQIYEIANKDLLSDTKNRYESHKIKSHKTNSEIRAFYWKTQIDDVKQLNGFLDKKSTTLTIMQRNGILTDLEAKLQSIEEVTREFLPEPYYSDLMNSESSGIDKQTQIDNLQAEVNGKIDSCLNMLNELLRMLRILQRHKLDLLDVHAVDCELSLKEFQGFCMKIDLAIAKCVADTYTKDKIAAFKTIRTHLDMTLAQLNNEKVKQQHLHKVYNNLDREFNDIHEDYVAHKKILKEKKEMLAMLNKYS
jgi:hypothetical protein